MDFETIVIFVGLGIGLIGGGVAIGFGIYNFIKMPTLDKIEVIKALLLQLMQEAETTYGSETGKLKLANVVTSFYEGCPKFLKNVLSYNKLMELIDEVFKANKSLIEKFK
jgi:hypothetical protein